MNLRALLGPAAAETAQEEWRAANGAAKAFAQPPGDRRLRRQRRSQDSHSQVGQACSAAHQASSAGLHLSTLATAAMAAKTQTTYLQGSSRPPAPSILVLLVARWLLPNTQELIGLHLCLLFESNMPPRCEASSSFRQSRKSWSRGQMVTGHPSERARAAWQNRRVRHQCITSSGTPSVSVPRRTTAPLPLFLHATRPKYGRRVETAPLSAAANHSIYPSARRWERRPRCQRQKPGRSVETRGASCPLSCQNAARASPARTCARTRHGTTLQKALTRAVPFLDPSRGPAFDVGQLGVASTVLASKMRQAALGVKLSMLVGFCALVLRSEFPQVNTALVTHPCGRALFVTAGCSAGVSHTLIFVLVSVFERALVSYSFTAVHHHVVLANVVLLTMFAPSLDYHISIGETLDRIISPR